MEGGPEEVNAMFSVVLLTPGSGKLELSAQHGNDEQRYDDNNDRDQDERQNLLFLPLLIPIFPNFRLLGQASTFLNRTLELPRCVMLNAVRAVACSG
jgi:hypothetical protein